VSAVLPINVASGHVLSVKQFGPASFGSLVGHRSPTGTAVVWFQQRDKRTDSCRKRIARSNRLPSSQARPPTGGSVCPLRLDTRTSSALTRVSAVPRSPQQDLDVGLVADPLAGRLTSRAIQIVHGNPAWSRSGRGKCEKP
jgi:hypothetical protein